MKLHFLNVFKYSNYRARQVAQLERVLVLHTANPNSVSSIPYHLPIHTTNDP